METPEKTLGRLMKSQRLTREQARQDYALSWVLVAIGRSDFLSEALVLKGGVALKKEILGPVRFSKELDFTWSDPDADPGPHLIDRIQADLRLVCAVVAREAPIRLLVQAVELRPAEGHPKGWSGILATVRYALPGDIAFDRPERLALAPSHVEIEVSFREARPDARPYSLAKDAALPAAVQAQLRLKGFTIEQQIAEKLRAILQQKLRKRRRPRDLHDLARLCLETYDTGRVRDLFMVACDAREVPFTGPELFFEPDTVERLREEYDDLAATVIGPLTRFEDALERLRAMTGRIFPSSDDATRP